MRMLFWVTAGLGLAFALTGFFVFSTPLIPDVLGELVDAWYANQAVVASVLGLVVGGASGVLARHRLRHRPHEEAGNFLSRVGAWGFWTVALMVLLAAVLTAARAGGSSFVPLAPFNRVLALAATGKFFGVLGAAAAAAALTYAIATRAANWGGRFALLPSGTTPARSLKHGS